MNIIQLAQYLPGVKEPDRTLGLSEKLKWTAIVLVLYFVLGSVIVYGIQENAVAQLKFLEIIFGSTFGSLITLGIGPIVTASIILQLLVGSKILNWDTKTPEGRAMFTSAQKLLAVFFSFFEAAIYVLAGAVPAAAEYLIPFVILQLAAGGILIILMDEVCSKWGIGSGVSLFIAAGVSKTVFVRIFSPFEGGVISGFVHNLMSGEPAQALLSFLPLISLIMVFVIVIYAQAMKIEIPMAISMPFGKFAVRRWPLRFIYTSNIPVILTAAVLANLQLMGMSVPLLKPVAEFLRAPGPNEALGLKFAVILSGMFSLIFIALSKFVFKKYTLRMCILGGLVGLGLGILMAGTRPIPEIVLGDVLRAVVYTLFMIGGSILFSVFWVNTAGMDAKTVAEQFKSSYLTLPGFRRDPRIIERILERYIPPLAVLGGAFVGFLAAFADLTGAIGTGTGILLTVMIIHQFYEQISRQHVEEMHPMVRRFVGV
ncbi:MAG: preprotein translocase subunit SecY [Candidatus Micrarchaeota archaeon]|nr:preprotein translocase subunit SecY [Candidatus Micrarchaeota archaeon]